MSDFLEQSDDDDDTPTAPFWMATFSDMVTLLMTFFIMIVAMSEVEVQKFKDALSHFQGRTSVMESDAVMPPPTLQPPASSEQPEDLQREREAQYEAILEMLREEGLESQVQVNLTETGLHVVINDEVMFRSGFAVLIEPSRTVLRRVAELLGTSVESVIVEGHTDNRPIQTAQFPSNWELSTARASSVIRYLQEQPSALDPSRYAAVGFGEFRPRTTNTNPEGRAQNRRVEILFSWEPWQNQKTPYQTRLTAP